MLHENEETYVEFLRIRNVPVSELEQEEGIENHRIETRRDQVFEKILSLVQEDRDLMEKVGFYKMNGTNCLFRVFEHLYPGLEVTKSIKHHIFSNSSNWKWLEFVELLGC